MVLLLSEMNPVNRAAVGSSAELVVSHYQM